MRPSPLKKDEVVTFDTTDALPLDTSVRPYKWRIFHSKMQFGVELALLRTPPPLLGGREEQVASCRDEKRDDALTVPLRLMQYICC